MFFETVMEPLAISVTRSVLVERHELSPSPDLERRLPALLNPPSFQFPPKHNRWKSNPHPDNIVLPRKKVIPKKKSKDVHAIDPEELILRLEKHVKELKLKENGLTDEPLREMDWERIRRAQRPDRSRMSSRFEIRKEPIKQEPIIEGTDMFMEPRAVPPRNDREAMEAYASELFSAYREFPTRNESAATGSFEHFRSTPLRKESNAETFESESIESSRTSSRGSVYVTERIKSFQGLPPLFFQIMDNEHLNTETTLSLDSGADKPESIFGAELAMIDSFGNSDNIGNESSFGDSMPLGTTTTFINGEPIGNSTNFGNRETFGNGEAPARDQSSSTATSIMRQQSTSTSVIRQSHFSGETSSSGTETLPICIRQSALPQKPTIRESQIPISQFQTPILTLSAAPSQTPHGTKSPNHRGSQTPPGLRSDSFKRGRDLSPAPPPLRRSVSSEDTYKPLAQTMTYTYRRVSRPESWGPLEEEERSHPDVDSYYFMNCSVTGLGQTSPKPHFASHHASNSENAAGGPIKRLFGTKFSNKNTDKDLPSIPIDFQLRPPVKQTTEHYNLPDVLPDDFPVQRKNFLSLFKR